MIDNGGVRRLLAPGAAGLPVTPSKRVKLAAQAKDYGTIGGAELLPFAVTMIDMYEADVDVLELSKVLAEPGPAVEQEVVFAMRAAYAAACLAAHHRGDTGAVENGYSAGAGLLAGEGLRGYIDRPTQDRVLDDMIPPLAHAGAAVADMYTLAVMWRFGGSREFPAERILDDWERNKQYVRTLRGF